MSEHQPYDHALKSLMGDRAAEIIPQLLPEAELVSEENIEIAAGRPGLSSSV